MISHEHGMIFFHIPKAAGQSVENLFLKDLGLAWNDRLPLLLGPNSCNSIGPPVLAHLLGREYYEHHYISRALFESYSRFAVVRNPYTRVVSTYSYLKLPFGFDHFVTELLPNKLWTEWPYFVRPQVDYLRDADGGPLTENIFRFERLGELTEWLRGVLGNPNLELTHVNKSPRGLSLGEVARSAMRYGRVELRQYRRDKVLAETKDYRALFANQRTRDVVETLYKDDLETFGYGFP